MVTKDDNEKRNLYDIDKRCFLFKDWFDDICQLSSKYGALKVRCDEINDERWHRYNIVKDMSDGKLLFRHWVKEPEKFHDTEFDYLHIVHIPLDGGLKYNIVNIKTMETTFDPDDIDSWADQIYQTKYGATAGEVCAEFFVVAKPLKSMETEN